jgi:hypothetical protein
MGKFACHLDDPLVPTGHADGRSFPAHEAGDRTFKVTVVEMPGEDGSKRCGDERGNQGRGGRRRDQVRYRALGSRCLRPAIGHRRIERWLLLALFYRNNRLYQVEGNAFVAGGQAEVDAMRFQQSLDLT